MPVKPADKDAPKKRRWQRKNTRNMTYHKE